MDAVPWDGDGNERSGDMPIEAGAFWLQLIPTQAPDAARFDRFLVSVPYRLKRAGASLTLLCGVRSMDVYEAVVAAEEVAAAFAVKGCGEDQIWLGKGVSEPRLIFEEQDDGTVARGLWSTSATVAGHPISLDLYLRGFRSMAKGPFENFIDLYEAYKARDLVRFFGLDQMIGVLSLDVPRRTCYKLLIIAG